MERGGYIYIVSNENRTVFYVGVSASLYWRVLEHKKGEGSTFTKKYNCTDLIYYKFFTRIEEAIKKEKQLKKWKREWKLKLIQEINPELIDLTEQVKDFI